MRLTRPLHLLGYALLVVIALPEVASWPQGSAHGPIWIAAFAVFAASYVRATLLPPGARRWQVATLAVEVGAVITMSASAPCLFGCLVLVIVAWQVAHLFSPRVTFVWLAVQTVVMAAVVSRGCSAHNNEPIKADEVFFTLLEMAGFQAFAAIAVSIANREHAARRSLVRANAELHATQALLAEGSRADERMRIARELHDIMGHELSALALQLEVARNLTEGRAREHVGKARDLGDRLLAEVRGVVGAMRAREGTDLGPALRLLAESPPGLNVHLDAPESLVIEDGARAHCVLRCVQEMFTNTVRHAEAGNLWLRVQRDAGGGIVVQARDDGRGAAALRPGHGLVGMRERLEEMGGWLQVQASPARCFALSAWLPGRPVSS
jgi:signal transduction histidine kinase